MRESAKVSATKSSSQSAVEVLERVRDLLSSPDKWTQGASARAANGFVVRPVVNGKPNPDATCYCLGGTFTVVDPYAEGSAKAYGFLLHVVGGQSIVNWNDAVGRTWKQVMQALDDAIVLARLSS